MPSFQDSAVLILLALLLFGPKGLAKLARQLGKLMGEFRRASNDFRLQMEEEFRLEEQADQQKKIEAMKAAAPVTAPLPVDLPVSIGSDLPEPSHPHMPPDPPLQTDYSTAAVTESQPVVQPVQLVPQAPVPEPLPIASSGSVNMMPPATGLPQPRSGSVTNSVAGAFDSIPHADPIAIDQHQTSSAPAAAEQEAPVHG